MASNSKQDLGVASLNPIFHPKSIAVIGASAQSGKIGREILHNLLLSEYQGVVYPVHPTAKHILSLKAYPSVMAIEDEVDLAIIVVKKQLVLKVADECGRKGIKGLVVITAGFREIGGEGIELEQRLLRIVHKYNMRMVGPNCMGIVNTAEGVQMNATFASTTPRRGSISFLSQSGALGVAILENAEEYGLGLAQFVSLGNKADVFGNDMLDYWRDDPNTKLVLMYLESFGNPRSFVKISEEVSRRKPILAVKSGRTARGALAASSHTGAIAGQELITDVLFEKAGVIRIDTMEELFDISKAFVNQPPPPGDRIAIISNAGGPGILATDALENYGLQVATFTEQTTEALREILPEESSCDNPVDMIASADGERYQKTIQLANADPNVDGILVIFVPPITADPVDIAGGIIAGCEELNNKPVLACFMGEQQGQALAALEQAGIPNYIYPESAVRSLAALNRYRQWREKRRGEIAVFSAHKSRVKTIIDQARSEEREHLTQAEVFTILKTYGIPVAAYEQVQDVEAAVAAAAAIGYPVVLKLDSPKLVHKSDAGGVKLDIGDEAALRQAWEDIYAAALQHIEREEIAGILVQKMAGRGRETIMGMTTDPSIGPLLMFGLGGIYVEVLKDVKFKIVPITNVDARELVTGIKGFKLLSGTRGEQPADVISAQEVLQRLSQLITDIHDILEMDINPFLLYEQGKGGIAVDGRMRIDLKGGSQKST